ncbi:uncharacterized protein LOC143084274 [Mytilus galloprovincialis]|uniref:uncharacterized protein LOC143084274 n=1 Tax=Mytilus galloprovincialis TaxID=29158 RepID=UPI003F7C327B
MATNTSVCSICDLRHITSSSKHWCPECDEALCSDCIEHHGLSRATRSHKTISISQYQSLPTFVTDIQQFCIYHNEKYQQYCMTHECPICYKCIKEHGKCCDVISLEDIISEVKCSELFRDLEQSLKDVLEHITRIRDDRENNIKSIQNQKKKITMEIDQIKTQVNQHIDKLKESAIKELEQIYEDHSCRIQSIVSSLKDQEHEINLCSTEFVNITKYASDLQTFLGMREIQSKLTDNESRLKSMIANKSLEKIDIQLAVNEKVSGILTSIKAFGSITIEKGPFACINISSKKTRQAQITALNRRHSINTIVVELNKKLATECKLPHGCSITQNGLFIFTDTYYSNEKLEVINGQGKREYTIQLSTPLRLYGAFDVELINDDTVAVTTGNPYVFGQRNGIRVIDLISRKEIKFIDLTYCPFGITYDGKSLICCVQGKDINVVSCTDYSITTVPNTVLPAFSYVSTHADKIYFTNLEKNKATCCLYDGTRLWEFSNEKVLREPLGITVDDKGNVFVVGGVSCNVLVITPGGEYKEILNQVQGLRKPFAISIDKLRNQLLVTDAEMDACLFKIID